MTKHEMFRKLFQHPDSTVRLEYGLDFIKAMPEDWTDAQRWAMMVELYDELVGEQMVDLVEAQQEHYDKYYH